LNQLNATSTVKHFGETKTKHFVVSNCSHCGNAQLTKKIDLTTTDVFSIFVLSLKFQLQKKKMSSKNLCRTCRREVSPATCGSGTKTEDPEEAQRTGENRQVKWLSNQITSSGYLRSCSCQRTPQVCMGPILCHGMVWFIVWYGPWDVWPVD